MDQVDIIVKIPDRINDEIEQYAEKSGIEKDKWFHNAIMTHLNRNRELYDKQVGTIGWKQFIASKRGMIDKFDRAKEIDKAHKTNVYRGIVAESVFRTWLSQFLPKKFGVTAGYILSQCEPDSKKLSHFDVIIYDQLNSPVYWTEETSGSDAVGQSRAIPVEYVHGVIEVKASFRSAPARKAVSHLEELKPYLDGVDNPTDYPKRYFPSDFCSAVVFFEMSDSASKTSCKTSCSWLQPNFKFRGYLGGIILRPNDRMLGSITMPYFPEQGETGHVAMEMACGIGDRLSSFVEDLLSKLTGEPKHRYCFPAWMFPTEP